MVTNQLPSSTALITLCYEWIVGLLNKKEKK